MMDAGHARMIVEVSRLERIELDMFRKPHYLVSRVRAEGIFLGILLVISSRWR